jgi:hypothetical protein
MRYRYNPFHEPVDAAPLIAEFIANRYGISMDSLHILQQQEYLEQGREHCMSSPFTLLSDYGVLVEASMDDKVIDFCDSLGYWCEPWDDYELCFLPTDSEKERHYAQLGTSYADAERQPDSVCQRSVKQAKAILAQLPVVGFTEGGMHQFTWIRMKDFFEERGQVTRETVIHSNPHRLRDLEEAFEKIRRLPGVANIWYVLD